jgi:hypothetical protein
LIDVQSNYHMNMFTEAPQMSYITMILSIYKSHTED